MSRCKIHGVRLKSRVVKDFVLCDDSIFARFAPRWLYAVCPYHKGHGTLGKDYEDNVIEEYCVVCDLQFRILQVIIFPYIAIRALLG